MSPYVFAWDAQYVGFDFWIGPDYVERTHFLGLPLAAVAIYLLIKKGVSFGRAAIGATATLSWVGLCTYVLFRNDFPSGLSGPGSDVRSNIEFQVYAIEVGSPIVFYLTAVWCEPVVGRIRRWRESQGGKAMA